MNYTLNSRKLTQNFPSKQNSFMSETYKYNSLATWVPAESKKQGHHLMCAALLCRVASVLLFWSAERLTFQ